MIEAIKKQIEKLPTQEISALLSWVFDYHEIRVARDRIAPQAEAEAVRQLQEDGKLEMPDALKTPPRDVEDAPEWANPMQGKKIHLHQCYHPGDIIQYGGKLWKSVYPHLNHEVPGESEWWVEIEPAEADETSEHTE